ncbi:vesicle coat component [Elasticomyces elasticus]|nr:vesicle coat component [Elasticomyces elasticus]
MDDDGPHSSYTHGSSAASWNPALRPDTNPNPDDQPLHAAQAPEGPFGGAQRPHDLDSDDDFFDRYPGASPQAARTRPPQAQHEHTEDSTELASGVGGSESVPSEHDGLRDLESVPLQTHLEPDATTSEQETADAASSLFVPPEEALDEPVAASGLNQQASKEQEEAHGLERDVTPHLEATQEHNAMELETLDGPEGHPRNEDAADSQQTAYGHVDVAIAADHEPAENYEFQSIASAVDVAVQEDSKAPLLQDEEEMPTSEPVQDVVEEQASRISGREPSEQIWTEDTTTTREDPVAEAAAPPAITSLDSGGDEEAVNFGQFLSESQGSVSMQETAPATGTHAVANSSAAITQVVQGQKEVEQKYVTQTEVSNPEDEVVSVADERASESDLAAMWQAALDDDEFLDDADATDPSSFFVDDKDGFLADEAPQSGFQNPTIASPVQVQNEQTKGLGTLGYVPSATTAMRSPSRNYTPTNVQQQASAQQINRSPDSPQFFNSAAYSQNLTRPAPPQHTQSFADKAKGGYASPYDLPMDIVKPRKRPSHPTAPAAQPRPPPPRTSSMSNTSVVAPSSQLSSSDMSTASMSPPQSSHSNQLLQAGQPAGASGRQPSQPTTKDQSAFFAELPMVQKARPTRPSGLHTPGAAGAAFPTPPIRPSGAYTIGAPRPMPTPPPPSGLSRQPSFPVLPSSVQQQQHQKVPASFADLRPPEQLPLLPDVSSQPSTIPPSVPLASTTTSRYSPAPNAQTSTPFTTSRVASMPPPAPASNSRYSPAPPAQLQNRYASVSNGPPNPRQVMPFAPRTSSPLASHDRQNLAPSQTTPRSVSYQPSLVQQQILPEEVSNDSPIDTSRRPSLPSEARQNVYSPPRTNVLPAAMQTSPDRRQHQQAHRTPPETAFSLPRRSATQSPGAVMKGPKTGAAPFERAPSVHSVAPDFASAANDLQMAPVQRRRQLSRDLDFVVPNDERAQDPLQRWKGCPTFHWGINGTVVTSFPKRVPFYAAGQKTPSIKCTLGPVNLRSPKQLLPFDEGAAKFPGPLMGKGKGKKKDVLGWLNHRLTEMERSTGSAQLDMGISSNERSRTEEKLVLLRVLKIMVEYDGVLEGSPAVEEAARKVLLPNLAQTQESFVPNGDMTSISQSTASSLQPEPVSMELLDQLQRKLLEGNREGAVWIAAEQRLWAHALLISSTVGPELWRQVVHEFIRSELKKVGGSIRSLAALYEIFGGNAEESVDELVPPSARAGLQMISKADGAGSSTKDPLDGLNQWRETLGLIISNRSKDDNKAIAALGKLLATYGRIEAAHVCYLFSRASSSFSGADDPNANVVLLGTDYLALDVDAGRNLDSILLSEIYEYAVSLGTSSTAVAIMPHLQNYKLIHAYELAEHGYVAEAQSYCDAIASTMKASTRPSPYYHAQFISLLDDLGRRLSQAPQPSSSGAWITKPSMDKVSGTMWNKFNKFVVGDDSDKPTDALGTSTERGEHAGPFGRIAGGTPTISRQTSSTDLYGTMANGFGGPISLSTSASTKYAPFGGNAPKPMPEQADLGRYAPQSQDSYTSGRPSLESSRSYDPIRPDTGSEPADLPQLPAFGYIHPPQQRPQSTPHGAYVPQARGMQGLSVFERPEVSRAASDYLPQYGQSMLSPLAPTAQLPSPLGSAASCETHLNSEHESLHHAYSSPPLERRGSYEPVRKGSFEPMGTSLGLPQGSPYEPSPQVEEDLLPSFAYGQPQEESHEALKGFDDDVPVASGYEPPSTSYETPSYQPYQPDEPPSPAEDEQPRSRKKMFGDDDDEDDLAARAAALKKAQAAQADKTADEAFRKAAEADAAKDKKAEKKGWGFGGWFKKDPNAMPGPIKAKLGEENNFYYDKDLGKWVNKKGGPAAETPSATPPPPKGVMRTASAAAVMGPPSAPPSRQASGLGMSNVDGIRPPMSGFGMTAPSASSTGPPSGPPSAPPSRIATPASSENLVGEVPLQRAVSTPGPPGLNGLAPPSRPSTGMSKPSSAEDDFYGAAPTGKKGGTVKRSKKTARYVDVMANGYRLPIRAGTIEDLEPAAHVLALALFNEEVFGDIIHPHRHEYPDDTYIFFLHKLRAEWIKPSNRILVATAPTTPSNGSESTTSTITGLAQWTRKSTATDATHDTTDPPPATWDRPPYPQTARWTPQQKTSSSAQTRISSTTGAAGAPRAGTSPSSGCIRLTTDRVSDGSWCGMGSSWRRRSAFLSA